MNPSAALFLATSYPPPWVMLSGLVAVILFLPCVLYLLLAVLTIFFRARDNLTRRRVCRLLLPLSGACLAFQLISRMGDELNRHHPLEGIFTNADFYKDLAIPVGLILASLVVLLLDRRFPRAAPGVKSA